MNQFWLGNPLDHKLLRAGKVPEELLSITYIILLSSA